MNEMHISILNSEAKIVDGFYVNNDKEYFRVLSITHGDVYDDIVCETTPFATEETYKDVLKQNTLDNLDLEVNGKLFHIDDTSLSRMDRAISALEYSGQTEVVWILKEPYEGSKTITVDINELKQVMALGMQKLGETLMSFK